MVITINGQAHELHFGMKALEIFFSSSSLLDKDSVFSTDQITAVIWGGLKNGAYRQQKQLSISFAALSDWIDSIMLTKEGQEILTEAMKEFNESQSVKMMVDKMKPLIEDDVKKKNRTSKK